MLNQEDNYSRGKLAGEYFDYFGVHSGDSGCCETSWDCLENLEQWVLAVVSVHKPTDHRV